MTAQQPPQDDNAVLIEVRATRAAVEQLNVKLFGEADGSVPAQGKAGRLVEVEAKVENHESRLTWVERIAYGAVGAGTVIEFLHVMGVIHIGH